MRPALTVANHSHRLQTRLRPTLAIVVASVMTLWSVTAAASCQGDKKTPPPPAIDPYTEKKPELMKAAGYVAFAPFPWADEHDTEAIERVLGAGKILFVETAHFKIGVGLPPYTVPVEKEAKQKLVDDLKKLSLRLPKVKPTARELDPWLRLHLIAQRCEAIYAEIQKMLAVTDADFPEPKVKVPAPATEEQQTAPTQPAESKPEAAAYMGEGRYLGQRGKYTVLVVEKNSSLGRYLNRFCRIENSSGSMRFLFAGDDTLFYGGTMEGIGTTLDDRQLHAEITYNVVQNLLSGYKHYWHATPLWLVEGLAHWYQRRVNPKWNTFVGTDEGFVEARQEEDWAPKVRARVKHDAVTPFATLSSWFEPERAKFGDHMQMWSLADYLLAQEDGGVAKYLSMMKDRIGGETVTPTRDQLLARQQEALARAFGTDAKGLEDAWRKWVLAKYPAK